MLYEILTGAIPFSGKSATDILQKVRTQEPPKIEASSEIPYVSSYITLGWSDYSTGFLLLDGLYLASFCFLSKSNERSKILWFVYAMVEIAKYIFLSMI